MNETQPTKTKPLSEGRARAAVLFLVFCMAAIIWISGERAIANVFGTVEAPAATQPAFEWPNGGQMAPHAVYQMPNGDYEMMPVRCGPVFEDGSTYGCPDWDGNAGELETNKLRIMALQKAMLQQIKEMQK